MCMSQVNNLSDQSSSRVPGQTENYKYHLGEEQFFISFILCQAASNVVRSSLPKQKAEFPWEILTVLGTYIDTLFRVGKT